MHAEIKALQQFGLCYKDAAHRLYHSEVQKLGAEGDRHNVISGLRRQIDILITEDISDKIRNIDDDIDESAVIATAPPRQ